MSTGNKLNKNRIALNLEIHDFVYSRDHLNHSL